MLLGTIWEHLGTTLGGCRDFKIILGDLTRRVIRFQNLRGRFIHPMILDDIRPIGQRVLWGWRRAVLDAFRGGHSGLLDCIFSNLKRPSLTLIGHNRSYQALNRHYQDP